jgi:hypothetical protein
MSWAHASRARAHALPSPLPLPPSTQIARYVIIELTPPAGGDKPEFRLTKSKSDTAAKCNDVDQSISWARMLADMPASGCGCGRARGDARPRLDGAPRRA